MKLFFADDRSPQNLSSCSAWGKKKFWLGINSFLGSAIALYFFAKRPWLVPDRKQLGKISKQLEVTRKKFEHKKEQHDQKIEKRRRQVHLERAKRKLERAKGEKFRPKRKKILEKSKRCRRIAQRSPHAPTPFGLDREREPLEYQTVRSDSLQ